MGKRGIFITFEGIDGCGKTTQLRLLGEKLRRHGHEVVETIEPGGTAIGKQIRRILLDSANRDLKPTSELLLYFASRAQNVEEVIRPALESGRFVLCDRFTDSTLVYQGCGRGLEAETVLTLDRIACSGLRPDCTVLIDVDLETSLARAHRRNEIGGSAETRIDDESIEFHGRVRDGYLALAEQERERFLVIDGRAKIGTVADRVWEAVEPHV
ncbi:MAG: dTMP kinase [Acidobacteriota bacterium]|nr:dTMP kinase [Acidobacteriota bacterium]